MQKNFALLWSVTAFTATACFNARRKFNLAWPYSLGLFCLFLRVLSCSQQGCSALFVSRASWGRGWSPTGWVTACTAFSGELFLSSGGTAATLTVLLPLPFPLFFSWGIFSSGIVVIKDKWVKPYLGWGKTRAEEKRGSDVTLFFVLVYQRRTCHMFSTHLLLVTS